MTILAGVLIAGLYIVGTFGVLVAIPAENLDPLDGFFNAIKELCSVFGPGQQLAFSIVIALIFVKLPWNLIPVAAALICGTWIWTRNEPEPPSIDDRKTQSPKE